MRLINNSLYNRDDNNYQDLQERQVAALREFYMDGENGRMTVLLAEDVEEPLELTRIYGPFCLDVVEWAIKCKVTLGVSADGREYVEY